MNLRTSSTLVFACHSAACRPPTSGGTGGSSSSKSRGGSSGSGPAPSSGSSSVSTTTKGSKTTVSLDGKVAGTVHKSNTGLGWRPSITGEKIADRSLSFKTRKEAVEWVAANAANGPRKGLDKSYSQQARELNRRLSEQANVEETAVRAMKAKVAAEPQIKDLRKRGKAPASDPTMIPGVALAIAQRHTTSVGNRVVYKGKTVGSVIRKKGMAEVTIAGKTYYPGMHAATMDEAVQDAMAKHLRAGAAPTVVRGYRTI